MGSNNLSVLSKQVLYLQKHPADERVSEAVKQEMMKAFYTLPHQWHFLPEEALSEFMLSCEPSFNDYIDRYRGPNSFESYLFSIIRTRAQTYRTNWIYRTAKQNIMDYLIRSPLPQYSAGEPSYKPHERLGVSVEELPYLFRYLLVPRPARGIVHSPLVRRLLWYLGRATTRKGFILSMSIQPEPILSSYLPLSSKLLGVSEETLGEYLSPLQMELADKRIQHQSHIDRVSFRYSRMLILHGFIQYQHDQGRSRPENERKYRYNKQAWRNSTKELMEKRPLVISHARLGELLHVSRGTIGSAICEFDSALKTILDEAEANAYLEPYGYPTRKRKRP